VQSGLRPAAGERVQQYKRNIMLDIKTILVPTDFSKNAETGVKYARDLAGTLGAQVVLLHVSVHQAMAVMHGFGGVPIPRDVEVSVNRAVEEGFQASKGLFDDPAAVRTAHVHGNADAEIIEYATSESVDLIVMSTHGHTGFDRLLLGSTAERVVRRAPCPVITVHPPAV
jgi:nucleotide-binding universal stress UspA family protein